MFQAMCAGIKTFTFTVSYIPGTHTELLVIEADETLLKVWNRKSVAVDGQNSLNICGLIKIPCEY